MALHNSSRVGETDLLTMWSDADLDLSDPVRKGQNAGIKIGDHETLQSQTLRCYVTLYMSFHPQCFLGLSQVLQNVHIPYIQRRR